MSKIDRIRRTRSYAEVVSIINEIGAACKGRVQRSRTVTAAARKGGDVEIDITRGETTPVRRTRTRRGSKLGAFPTQLTGYKAPTASAVKSSKNQLAELYENVQELEALEAILIQSYSSMKTQPAALAAVKKLRAEVDKTIQSNLYTLNTVAVKHFPKEMVAMRDHLTTFLIDNIDSKQYADIGYLEYITPGDKGEMVFSCYIELEQLRNSKGFVFPEYFIILSAVVTKNGGVEFHLNALPDFRVPGKYPLGRQVRTERELDTLTSQLLSHNNVITELDRAPMPLKPDEPLGKNITKMRGVKSVRVEDDALLVEVGQVSDRQKDEIAKKVIAALNATMRRRKDANISWRGEKIGGKSYLKFILYFKPGTTTNNLNMEQFSNISDMFGLTPKQRAELRRSLLD